MTRYRARKEGRDKVPRERRRLPKLDFTVGDEVVDRILDQVESEVI